MIIHHQLTLTKLKVTKELYGKLVWLLEQYVESMRSL